MADKYGIPEGGDSYPGKVKYYQGKEYELQDIGIAVAVAEAGWPDNLIAEAVSVAIAESRGRPFIYNTYKKGHFGLFQISRSAWPEFFAGDSDNWTIPTRNAEKGYQIYKKQGWGAWQASRLTNLARGKKAASDLKKLSADKRKEYAKVVGTPLGEISDTIPDNPIGDAIDDALTPDWAGDVAAVAKDAYQSLTTPAFWMRVGYGGLGLVLLAGGMFLMVRNTAIQQTVGKIIPKGAK